MSILEDRLYLTEVDKNPESIYCLHDILGEKSVPAHAHRKGQFIYVEGRGIYVFTDHQSFFLPSRHFMWIPPEINHSFEVYNSNFLVRNLYMPVLDSDNDFFRKCGIYPVNDLLIHMIIQTSNWSGHIDKENLAAYHFVMAMKYILPESENLELHLALPTASDQRLKSVLFYLEENLNQSDNFPEIASHFNFSERTLSRLFQKDLGMSFSRYNTILKIIKAVKLLLEDQFSVNEIADMVGYHSIPTFSNSFKKFTGLRPTEFVKMKNVLR
jgi:AraC-like DNA-binding protein